MQINVLKTITSKKNILQNILFTIICKQVIKLEIQTIKKKKSYAMSHIYLTKTTNISIIKNIHLKK